MDVKRDEHESKREGMIEAIRREVEQSAATGMGEYKCKCTVIEKKELEKKRVEIEWYKNGGSEV